MGSGYSRILSLTRQQLQPYGAWVFQKKGNLLKLVRQYKIIGTNQKQLEEKHKPTKSLILNISDYRKDSSTRMKLLLFFISANQILIF